MKHSVVRRQKQPITIAKVQEVPTENVWQWLSAGWQDILKAPIPSLFYGLSLTLLSAVISISVALSGTYYLLPLLLAGFLLVAPLLGIGPYTVSQQLELDETPTIGHSLRAFGRNTFPILSMGVILVLCFLAWAMVGNLIFIFFHQGLTPATWQGFVGMLLGTWDGAQLLVAGTYVGALIALGVFSISAVSVPMLVDRQVNVFEAIQTSLAAVRWNLVPMLLWAAVLISIILFSFLTLYLGLIIGFPLAAHASWHAYRDLVEH